MNAAMPLTLDITHFAKTIEGARIIKQGVHFCIAGQIWQGWQGVAIKVEDTQPAENELRLMVDVDGSKKQILGRIKLRNAANAMLKRDELAKRRLKSFQTTVQEADLELAIDRIAEKNPERAAALRRDHKLATGAVEPEDPDPADPDFDPETEPAVIGLSNPQPEAADDPALAMLSQISERLGRFSERLDALESKSATARAKPAAPKKMHWKTRERMEKLNADRGAAGSTGA